MPRDFDIAIPRSYSVIALATFFLVSSGIWLFCFVVDPYDLYPKVPGLSQEKSVDLFYYLRLHKPYAVERIQPRILIAGSSRAAGIPPLPLEALGGKAYNAALPGATLREIQLMVAHAYAINPQKVLLVSLDHPMFRDGNSDQMLRFEDTNRYQKIDATLRDKLQNSYQRLEDLWRSLFSVDALMDSLHVLFGGGRSDREYQKDGTWDMDMHEGATSVNRLYATLSRQIYSGEMADKSGRFKFEELTDLLDFTDANGIRVILLVSPMQALLMQTLYLAGTWEYYLKWQRDLVAVVEARNTDTKIFGIEDNALLVQEALNTPNPLFRDGIHYTRKAGIEIAKCLSGPCDSNLQPTRLDNHMIDSYLEQVDVLRRQYVREHPTDVAKLHKWLELQGSDGT